MLIIFSGLPGSGKTTLSKALAAKIGATYLRADSIENAMAESVLRIEPAEDAGYRAAYAVARDNLMLGRTVIGDSVNPIELTRNDWRLVAETCGANSIDVEIVCSDPVEHRKRIEARNPQKPTWEQVCARKYDAWDRDRIVIDTAGAPVDRSFDQLVSQLPHGWS